MNKGYILISLLLASAVVLYNLEVPPISVEPTQYIAFLTKFSKPIPSPEQMIYRSKIYADFLKTMEKHNSDPTQTWKMGVNQFSDLTQE